MIKSLFCLIASFILSIHLGSAQSITPVHVDSFTIDSKGLNETCKVYLYLPQNYNSTTEKYPVVYLLDGEYYSSYVADVSALLAQSQLAPACIIIGITSNNRQRDFSPALDENTDQTQDIQFAGGADHFLSYVKNELIPTVDEKYRTSSYRLLIGHSTGGLLAYYSLYKTPGLFQAIISIDGSTWWNKGKVGKEVIEYLSSHPDYKGKIFECRKDIHIPVRYPPNIELLTFLDTKRPVGLEYYYLELPNETHGTIVIPGIYYGLKGIFSTYSKEQN